MFWPKLTVSNYPEMLRKLSFAMFFVALAIVWFLRSKIQSVNAALSPFDYALDVKVFVLSVPFASFVIAAIAAGVSEAVKLHDKISDVLKIRRNFDIYRILIPMALLSGATLSSAKYDRLKSERARLMGETFYNYASSSKGKAAIDPHVIGQALTAWSWYWICVEAALPLTICSVIAAVLSNWEAAAILLFALNITLTLAYFFKADVNKYAESEVRQILSDPTRCLNIQTIFNAL